MPQFELVSDFKPTGDQPQAIEQLVEGVLKNERHQTLLGATGTGKSLGKDDPVFVVVETADASETKIVPIGDLIDTLFAAHSTELRREGDTEILDVEQGSPAYYAQSFDPVTLKTQLHRIRSFVRHNTPAMMYRLETACGRDATLTGDHNLWVLRDGQLLLIETADVQPTDYIPLPDTLLTADTRSSINTLETLTDKRLFVEAPAAILNYVEQYGFAPVVASLTKAGIAHPYSKLSTIRHDRRGRGMGIKAFQQLLEATDNSNGSLDLKEATVGAQAKANRLPIQLPLTAEFLLLLGYYIAEGNYIILANRNPVVHAEIEAALNQLGIPFSARPSSDYQVSSTALAELMLRLCGDTARNKHLPPFWPELSDADLGQMLRAYFDGDGTVEKGSYVTALTASKQLASDLLYALLRFGIWGRLTRKWKRATNTDHAGDWYYQVSISGQGNLRRFQQHIGFSIEYKARALEQAVTRDENTNVDVAPINGTHLRWLRHQLGITAKALGERSNLSRAAIQYYETGKRMPSRSILRRVLTALRAIADQQGNPSQEWQAVWSSLHQLSNLRWTRVKSLEVSDYQHPYVYDLCVPGAENFLAGTGGFFVHNTFTAAHVIQELQRPALILAHNKTLAAQLYAEFKEFFPRNAVEYYVSYYDYYQPESYVPRYDLYIEKQTDINEQIERLRIAAKAALLSRRDVIIVASVSCIYATGDPATWAASTVKLSKGLEVRRENILRQLVQIQYTRGEMDLAPGTFRARGDVLEVFPPYEKSAFRITLFGDEIEKIVAFDPLTGELLNVLETVVIFPAAQFMADTEKLQKAIHDIEKELEAQINHFKREGKLLEAQRIEQRVHYDLEMLREMGFTPGIENYSRHLDQRAPGSPPWTLIDYFPKDYLMIIDESHMTIPQVRGMYNGDQSRKSVLVEYGFRLPSAMDNRPLRFDEFEERMGYTIFTSATPGPYEREISTRTVQQVIRPTGIVDPMISVRPTKGQIDDLLQEIAARVRNGQRALVTTLTQRMAEEMAGYINEMGIKANYLHAEINTLERVEILRDLRLGVYDVVVGINLLREGIDLPEVSLVAILDADKEGFLRSESALIQNIGRAARHIEGLVILYADTITDSMQRAIDETNRRRAIQQAYNEKHGITPTTIVKQVRDLTDRVKASVGDDAGKGTGQVSLASLPKDELHRMIKELETEMKAAAKALEFEKAAVLRDQVMELRQILADREPADDLLVR
jgi:excinuclease ABC B subunit